MNDRDPRIEVVAKAAYEWARNGRPMFALWEKADRDVRDHRRDEAQLILAALDTYEREHPPRWATAIQGLLRVIRGQVSDSDAQTDVQCAERLLGEHISPESVERDCPGCGAPAGMPPAGPCGNHESQNDELRQWATGVRILAGQAEAVGMGASAVLLRQIANEADLNNYMAPGTREHTTPEDVEANTYTAAHAEKLRQQQGGRKQRWGEEPCTTCGGTKIVPTFVGGTKCPDCHQRWGETGVEEVCHGCGEFFPSPVGQHHNEVTCEAARDALTRALDEYFAGGYDAQYVNPWAKGSLYRAVWIAARAFRPPGPQGDDLSEQEREGEKASAEIFRLRERVEEMGKAAAGMAKTLRVVQMLGGDALAGGDCAVTVTLALGVYEAVSSSVSEGNEEEANRGRDRQVMGAGSVSRGESGGLNTRARPRSGGKRNRPALSVSEGEQCAAVHPKNHDLRCMMPAGHQTSHHGGGTEWSTTVVPEAEPSVSMEQPLDDGKFVYYKPVERRQRLLAWLYEHPDWIRSRDVAIRSGLYVGLAQIGRCGADLAALFHDGLLEKDGGKWRALPKEQPDALNRLCALVEEIDCTARDLLGAGNGTAQAIRLACRDAREVLRRVPSSRRSPRR